MSAALTIFMMPKAASHASQAADDVVAVEPADFALHAPSSEEALQLEF
jgi:hypothetical protein